MRSPSAWRTPCSFTCASSPPPPAHKPNAPPAKEESRIAQWRQGNTTGEARSLDLAKLGDLQLERATDVLKGLMVYQQFNEPQTKAPAPPPPAETKPIDNIIRKLNVPDVSKP